LVDDDVGVIRVLREALERKGFAVVTAGNCRDALSLTGPFDALVLDHGLPDCDGATLATQWPLAVSVIISGHEPADLIKPFLPSRLAALIEFKLDAQRFAEGEP
jgi:DNA-binding NtrC family response regulator